MQRAVGRLVVRPVEVDRPVREERADDRERLLEPADPMVVREPVGSIVRCVPAGAEGEDQAALRDGVHRRRHLGEHRRGMETRAGDQRAEFDRGGRRGERGERRPHLPGPTRTDRQVVEQMVAEPDRVEADLLGQPSHLDQLRERHLPLDLRQLDSDLHGRSPYGAMTGEPWWTTSFQPVEPARAYRLVAATVPVPPASTRFSSTVTQAMSPWMATASFVRMNWFLPARRGSVATTPRRPARS